MNSDKSIEVNNTQQTKYDKYIIYVHAGFWANGQN